MKERNVVLSNQPPEIYFLNGEAASCRLNIAAEWIFAVY